MRVERAGSSWKLPAGFEFIHSRTLVVSHIRQAGDLYAICGAESTDKFGPPSPSSWSKVCPKCRKAAPRYRLEIPNLSPVKRRSHE